MSSRENNNAESTLSALLREKPKRGRPRHAVSRQNVYVELAPVDKKLIKALVAHLPKPVKKADLPDLAVTILTTRMEALRRAVAGRNREIPEGITDLESLYLLWDLPLPVDVDKRKWTSIRLSPQQAIELGRAHGTFKAVFGSSRSDTFGLGVFLLKQYLEANEFAAQDLSLANLQQKITENFL